MLDLFKQDIKIGDKVKIYLTTGKEPQGTIIEIGTNFILMKNQDGSISRIFEVLFGGWDILCDVEKSAENDVKDSPELNFDFNEKVADSFDKEESKEINLATNEVILNQNIEKIEDPTISSNSSTNFGVKIVGKIELNEKDKQRNRFPNGRTYRIREVASILELSVSEVVLKVKDLGYEIEDHNPNFRIDQKIFDVVQSQIDQEIDKQENSIIAEAKGKVERFNSFSDLSSLKEKIRLDISSQMLPANSKIKRVVTQNYGFLTDNEGVDYYFRLSEIKDEQLLTQLGDSKIEGIQVIADLESFGGYLIAKNIFLPNTVDYFHELAISYLEQEKQDIARSLLQHILDNFPDYHDAKQLKNKLEYQDKRKFKSNFSSAIPYRQSRLEDKKKSESHKVRLLESIERNDRFSEKALKEYANILMSETKFDEAIEIIKKHESIIKSTNPNSFIAYFYEVKKDYANAIHYLKKINPTSKEEGLKLAKRLALSYVGNGDYAIAEKEIDKVLDNNPNDSVVKKLKEVVNVAKSEGSEEEIQSIFKEAQIQSISGGLSKYCVFVLEGCELSGVPASEVAEAKFGKKTLENLKAYIETIKDGRPKERAEAYLSQARIEQLLDSENSKSINGALAKYFTSKSVYWAKEGGSPDTLRYFILESASLDTSMEALRYIPMYLDSFYKPMYELRGNKMVYKDTWNTIVSEFLNSQISSQFWYGILEMIMMNSLFSAQFLTSLFKNEEHRSQSLIYLTSYLGIDEIENCDEEKFLELWKSGREKLKRDKDNYSTKLLALTRAITIDALIDSYRNLIQKTPDWLGQLNRQRLASINDILEAFIEFNKHQTFEEKERYYNIIASLSSNLIEEIQASPTELSFNSLNPLINHVVELIEKGFEDVLETSKPVINIKVYGESSKEQNLDYVFVQLAISNKKDCAPVSDFIISIKNDSGIEFINENNTLDHNLKGGDEQILKLKLKVQNEIISEGATNIKVEYSYRIRGNEEEFMDNEDLTLRFYSSSDFEKIENVFATTADSGPVQDTAMFFGRDEFIANIKVSISNSKSKCVIIYGQKRSGKSSVLHHLKERLNNTPETFCISFSLGEIIEDLSPKTFYYTILSEIEDTLITLKDKMKDVPQYEAPEYKELDEVPTILFNDQMKLLNREFKKFPEWSNKKLVLLIDEFTYIYTAIQKKQLSDQFMKTWKSFSEKGYFNSVLIGQDIMPKFKSVYPNEFGVTEDKRLSYLKKSDAIELIEKPIWDNSRSRSRFLGKATDLILDYTSSNPYYVQIFCARLVDYLNEHKAISVTEADVHDVAESFIKGEQALTADKFNNLITAGDADLDAFDAKDVLFALKAIAIASKNLDSCSREAINLGDRDYEENILKDLKDREVLSCPQPGYYKINVRLFKEWLLIN
jgi:TolA-binding protein